MSNPCGRLDCFSCPYDDCICDYLDFKFEPSRFRAEIVNYDRDKKKESTLNYYQKHKDKINARRRERRAKEATAEQMAL